MKNNLKFLLQRIIAPKSKNENLARREYILNILLITIIFLMSIGAIIIFYHLFFSDFNNYENNSLPLIFVLGILLFFATLYFLSRRGYSRYASYIFLCVLFIITAYMGYKWGVDLPAEILFYVLIIVMSGILVGTKMAFTATIFTSLFFIIIGHLQKANIILANRSWIIEPWGYSDAVMTSIILFIIATVSYLFNYELEKSFKRLKESEVDLKIEKDLLETRVKEKTQELKEIQAKEIAQVHRFSEFGKLSSGLFHDLVNPLTIVMLNVNKMKLDGENQPNFNLIKSELEQVSRASERMREFINSVRKQISPQGKKEPFCLNQEVEDAISVLNYKTCKNQICLLFSANEKLITTGDAIKFSQIVTNLISNAIDAYDDTDSKDKEIKIDLKKQENFITLSIIDKGKGIEDINIDKIFEPFFTTKTEGNNLGLGLALIKKIIEEDFLGNIKVTSNIGKGSTFTINFPLI